MLVVGLLLLLHEELRRVGESFLRSPAYGNRHVAEEVQLSEELDLGQPVLDESPGLRAVETELVQRVAVSHLPSGGSVHLGPRQLLIGVAQLSPDRPHVARDQLFLLLAIHLAEVAGPIWLQEASRVCQQLLTGLRRPYLDLVEETMLVVVLGYTCVLVQLELRLTLPLDDCPIDCHVEELAHLETLHPALVADFHLEFQPLVGRHECRWPVTRLLF